MYIYVKKFSRSISGACDSSSLVRHSLLRAEARRAVAQASWYGDDTLTAAMMEIRQLHSIGSFASGTGVPSLWASQLCVRRRAWDRRHQQLRGI